MSFTLTDEDMVMDPPNDRYPINYAISGYFEGEVGDDGDNTLDQAYALGMQRLSADEYLWNLSFSKLEEGDYTFSNGEIRELREQNPIIQAAEYPQRLKDAIAQLLRKLNDLKFKKMINSKATNQAIRNVYERKTSDIKKKQAIRNVYERNTSEANKNQAIRNIYKRKIDGNNSAPGRGPANIIRKFAGVNVPRGAEGGSRKKSSKSKKNRKVKKTLRKRK